MNFYGTLSCIPRTCAVEEGDYIVSAPALPGCATQGGTEEEALAMIQDASRGYILSLAKHGDSLPLSCEAGKFKVVEIETAA